LLRLIGDHAIGHGVLVEWLVVQRSQQSSCPGEVPSTHLEPTQIELNVAVQTELGIRADRQYIQISMDVHSTQFKWQDWLWISIDAYVLVLILIVN